MDIEEKKHFNLIALLLDTINDFTAYDNLSRYIIKGYCVCPIFEENTH